MTGCQICPHPDWCAGMEEYDKPCGESPFEEPNYQCRECGCAPDHTYCIRWMEWLHRLFNRSAK